MFPKLAVGIIIIVAQLFVFVNAPYIYGPYASQVTDVLLVYFVMMAMFSPFVLQIMQKLGPQDLANFSITFIFTAVLMLAAGSIVQGFSGTLESSLALALGFGFLHGLIKAFDEEVIFRGVLPQLMGGSLIADVISSVLFGVFHLAVYGTNLLVMLVLIGLGFTWAMVRRRFGLMGAAGSHFAYNLAALGVLPMIF